MSEDDALLRQRLDWFQDLRFGLFIHWGIYAQLGVIESWPLVWEDRSWSNPTIQSYEELEAFRKHYRAQNRIFNPTQFHPQQWAHLAKRAGMKYVVFTTKHHDGFCMYDSKFTDYKVTAPTCPFSRTAQPDIARTIFDTFRDEGFAIGAYFSKSDWNSPYYWDPARPALDRNPNYDTAAEPQRWKNFVDFAHNQMLELLANYGKIDILWLDAGQVKPPTQDLQMDDLVANARSLQPHLIVVDRLAGTQHENVLTPEQEVPDQPLAGPWESCVTMGKQWSYKPDDEYKSARQLIHLLIDVVAKGGNLLLNVGPDADGNFPQPAIDRLNEIGDWMQINSEAIHNTRATPPYKQNNIAFTRRGDTLYAFYLLAENENAPPKTLRIESINPPAAAKVTMLGASQLNWRMQGNGIEIDIPPSLIANPPCHHAFVFKIDPAFAPEAR